MINQVSSTNLLQMYKTNMVTQEPKPQENKQPEIAEDIVKKETADATKAYLGVIAPNPKVIEKKSLQELKTDLLAQGKVEGKDFKVDISEFNSQLSILENDKPVKRYRFNKDGATKEDFETVQTISYPIGDDKGLKSTETTYGADGAFRFRTFKYEKENSPYKDDIVNFETKPFELENKLKANGVKFASNLDLSGDIMWNKITAFDPKTNEVTRYEFMYNEDNDTVANVKKCHIDENGNLKSYIYFSENETSFVDFKDNCIA